MKAVIRTVAAVMIFSWMIYAAVNATNCSYCSTCPTEVTCEKN